MYSDKEYFDVNKMRNRSEFVFDLLVSQINFDVQQQFVSTLININETYYI